MITLTDYSAQESVVTDTLHAIHLQQCKTVLEILNPKLEIDGNQWCYIWGQMPETYIVGFGDTPFKAMEDFCNSFYNQKVIPTKTIGHE